MNDKISIVTTLFNYARFLDDMINSCLKQTYENWELIIVDDCSKDDPMKVFEKYQGDERIKYIRFDKNRGYSVAKNEGIIASEGEYIVMIDADDMLTDISLAVRYEVLKEQTEKLWCHGEAWVLRGDHLSKESYIYKCNLRKRYKKAGRDIVKDYPANLIHAQTVMVRKELHRLVGLYDEELPFSSDKEMWLRILGFGYFPIYVNEFVSVYRVHRNQMHKQSFKKRYLHVYKPMRIEHQKRRKEEGVNSANTRLLEA